MAEIEASLLAKVQSAESSYDRPVLIGFLRGRKKRVGTLIEAAGSQSLKELKREIKKKGGKKLKVYKEINTIYAEMPVDKVQDLASVSCAQKVYDAEGDVTLSLYESVPLVMGVEKWQLPYRVKGHKLEGQGVKVAVIDSGIDKSHPDFGFFGWRVKASKNFSGGRASKGREHGTHVAGIIAGSGKASGYRYVGVAPKAKLYDAKVFMNSDTPTTRDTIIEATLWAVKKGVDVINMSFGDNHGCTDGTCPLCRTADYAVSKGITVVAAAGNVGPAEGTISCPGNAKGVITVGATTKTAPVVVAGYSSRGSTRQFDKPDLVAPGEKITAPQPGKSYTTMTGTSMAAPHVSGMAALLHQSSKYTKGKAQNFPAEIKQTLQRSSINLGEHKTAQGSGLVNFKNHLVSLQKVKKRRWWGDEDIPSPDKRYKFEKEGFEKLRRDLKNLSFLKNNDAEQIVNKLENDFGVGRIFDGEDELKQAVRQSLSRWEFTNDQFNELFVIILEDVSPAKKHLFKTTRYMMKESDLKKLRKDLKNLNFLTDNNVEQIINQLEIDFKDKIFEENELRKAVQDSLKNLKIWDSIEDKLDELFVIIREDISLAKRHFFKSSRCTMKNEPSTELSCPATMRMFCPYYDKQLCNHIYETCIHYQMNSQSKILKKVKENVH